eukprot:scaffold36410_cov65-Phaeocystis_antarctica.AAC.1
MARRPGRPAPPSGTARRDRGQVQTPFSFSYQTQPIGTLRGGRLSGRYKRLVQLAGWCRAGAFCGIQCVGARVWDGVAAGA